MTARQGRVVTFGEALGVFRSSSPGSIAHVSGFELSTGGAESNVAIGLSRLGVPATWYGRVGAEGIGRRVLRELRAEGVEVVAVVDEDAPTGVLVKETPAPGRSSIIYYRTGSAGSRLDASDLEGIDWASTALLHVTGITPALSDSAARAVDAAVDAARANGIPVSFDVNHRSRLWKGRDAAPVYRSIAARSELLFAGLDEARILIGDDAAGLDEAFEAIAALGPAEVVIKLGEDGAAARVGGAANRLPAAPVVVVDTVGAGDAFVAGYLAEWFEDRDPATRLATAVLAGAAACGSYGDWEASPRRADLAAGHGGDPVSR